jgi:thiamine transporter ThiT
MSEHATDYHHGDMDISEHAASYRLFGALAKWGSLTIAVAVLMLSLWFCTGVGFVGGLIPGVIVAAAGAFFLRSKPDPAH